MPEANTAFKTAAETAYEIIRDKIVRGELGPGERLTRRNMAKIAGVSIIPVIEALHQLEDEGLVVSEAHFGARVIVLDDNTIRDRFALRMAIECQVVRILALHKSEREMDRLLFLAQELDLTPRTDDSNSEFWSRHYLFHLRLAENTNCSSFVKELKRLNLFDILRRTITSLPEGTKTAVPKGHHERIVTAISSGDPDHAERIMRDHINFSHLVTESQF